MDRSANIAKVAKQQCEGGCFLYDKALALYQGRGQKMSKIGLNN